MTSSHSEDGMEGFINDKSISLLYRSRPQLFRQVCFQTAISFIVTERWRIWIKHLCMRKLAVEFRIPLACFQWRCSWGPKSITSLKFPGCLYIVVRRMEPSIFPGHYFLSVKIGSLSRPHIIFTNSPKGHADNEWWVGFGVIVDADVSVDFERTEKKNPNVPGYLCVDT